MIRPFNLIASIIAGIVSLTTPARASTSDTEVADCLYAAAAVHHVPATLLYAILGVEGGRLGAVSQNTNGSVDIGPMQVNDLWLPQLMMHWSASHEAAFLALRDSVCANFEAGAWILSKGFAETGDYWDAVARYHSHSGAEKARYLRLILERFEAMERARRTSPTTIASR